MRTPKARYGAIAVLAALSIGVAACGDDDADPATTPAAGTEPTASEPMTTEPMTTEPTAIDVAMTPSGPACGSIPADGEGSFDGMADDPAATAASNNPELSTLVAAVTAAGLVDTLNGDGPFTIFAPANSAFAKIPEADLEAVLADTDLLTSILTLHVVAGQQLASTDLAGMESVETVNGESVTLAMDGDTLTVNGQAAVVCADIPTANATVHIIDSVLMPMGGGEASSTTEPMTTDAEGAGLEPSGPACGDIPNNGEGSLDGMADDPAATAASNNPGLSTLVAAVTAAGLVDTLNGEGPFTIFAPANSAFDKIPPADLQAVLADTDLLTSILTLHVVGGEQLSSEDLAGMESVETVNGESLTLAVDGGALTVNGASTVVCADIPTANATVHIIDTVLMPMG